MRVQYTALLLPNIISLLKSHLPEPPSDAEMERELAGIERLEEALAHNESIVCGQYVECALCGHSLNLHTSTGFCELCIPLNGPCRYKAAAKLEEALREGEEAK